MSRLHAVDELAADVLKWAKEMGVTDLPTLEDIKYTCKGSMKQVLLAQNAPILP